MGDHRLVYINQCVLFGLCDALFLIWGIYLQIYIKKKGDILTLLEMQKI